MLHSTRKGGIKHLPVFIGGNKIKKLAKYRQKVSGLEWHGEVEFDKSNGKFVSNSPNHPRLELHREMIDNNIVLYNIPMKAIKDNNRKIFPNQASTTQR